MAMMTETQNVPSTLRGYFLDRVQSFKEARAQRALYRQTVTELQRLTNRELADLGIGRGEIHDIAQNAIAAK